ncbi:MAG: hypothetical protein EAZ92_03545 [Candidatus Kapaibacterium sp.]|nr:MAG: hypothetical protein EAZ92_03545 [Candidatus Kapabacteria bacterium]
MRVFYFVLYFVLGISFCKTTAEVLFYERSRFITNFGEIFAMTETLTLPYSSSLESGARTMTVAEFRAMEFDDDDPFYYELIEGELVRKLTPNPFHQRVSGHLSEQA